jgi:hypothetical protein
VSVKSRFAPVLQLLPQIVAVCFGLIFWLHATLLQNFFAHPRQASPALNDIVPLTTKGVVVYISPLQHWLLSGLFIMELVLLPSIVALVVEQKRANRTKP